MLGLAYTIEEDVLSAGFGMSEDEAHAAARRELDGTGARMERPGLLLCDEEGGMLGLLRVCERLKKLEWFRASAVEARAFELSRVEDLTRFFVEDGLESSKGGAR